MEVLPEAFGDDEDQLPVVDRFDDLFFDEAAEDLSPFLLAGTARAASFLA